MSYVSRTLFCLLCAVGLSVLFAAPGQAQQQMTNISGDAPVAPRGPFAIAADQNLAWRIDHNTGAVSYCVRDTNSNDPTLIAQRPPICSAWGK